MIIYSGTIFPFQMYLLPLYRLYLDHNYYDTKTRLVTVLHRDLYSLLSVRAAQLLHHHPAGTFRGGTVGWACPTLACIVRIYMPLSLAPMAALFLFQFTWIWNDLLFGITLARSDNVRPLMAGLAGMRGIYAGSNMPGVLAGAMIASVPTVLIFLGLRRYLLQGMVLTTQGE